MSISGVQINKTAVVVLTVFLAAVVVTYKFYWAPSQLKSKDIKDTKMASLANSYVQVAVESKVLNIFVKTVAPKDTPKRDILLLHGMKFSSANWEEIKTLKILADAGYKPQAVDLPGYGNSKDQSVDNKGAFIEALIKSLKQTRPVIISPSMSGSFSLPYIFKDSQGAKQRCSGYVPVAPVDTQKYTQFYKGAEVPTCIIDGEKDTSLGKQSFENLKNIPNAVHHTLKDSGHACYLDSPDKFHELLLEFLKSLKE